MLEVTNYLIEYTDAKEERPCTFTRRFTMVACDTGKSYEV